MSWLQVKHGHHQLNRHAFDSEGQGSLVCCSPWGQIRPCNWTPPSTSKTNTKQVIPSGSFYFLKANWTGEGAQPAPRGLGRPQNNLRSLSIKHKAGPQELEKATHPQLNPSTQGHSWLLITFPPFSQSEPCSLYLGANSPQLFSLSYFPQEWAVALYFIWEGYSIWWRFQLCGFSSRCYKI